MPKLFLKKVLSYLVPVHIETRKGDITPVLEIALVNGKYVLNGERVNYSFGGLQEVFRRVFRKFKLQQYTFENMLLLGFGAGSVVRLLRDEFGQKGTITGVENDGVMLDLAAEYFGTTRISGLTLVHEDAAAFVKGCTQTFDLIVIDLFIEEHIPDPFREEPFLQQFKRLLRKNGLLFFNVITEEVAGKTSEAPVIQRMRHIFPNLEVVPVVMFGVKNTMLVVR